MNAFGGKVPEGLKVWKQTDIDHRKMGRNDPCWCGSGRKYKQCHCNFDDKLELMKRQGHIVPFRSMIKTKEQIEKIKESAKINIAVLDYVEAHIKAGVTTEEIDKWVHDETIKRGGIPAPLNYQGYPKSVCTSINHVVCHGIPSPDVVLKEGDIVNVDVSTEYKGYFSDSSRMFCIGEVSAEKKRLVEKARECIQVGLEQVKPWGFLGDMGQAINDFAKENGYSIVRDIGGHAIGLEFHEDPWVSYVSRRGEEMVMAPGLMFTIEPMVNMGSEEIYVDDSDGWTVYTEDGLPSAQWEVQVLVTEEGYEIIAY
ncbi:MAG: methionyl aminopeptidase [Lachnospiraceae bacterium]|nr:methionyl aminopeptidase [Lachnospiraceae bacterium]